MPPGRSRRLWLSLLQLALAGGLIAILFLKMENRADVLDALRAIARRWPFGVAATLCFLGCLTAATRRWQRILAATGMRLSFARTLRLTFVGQFFNAFLFGALGGDAVKAFGVARQFPRSQAAAAASVFIDRMIGMLALFVIATAALLARLDFFLRYRETRVVAYALAACVVLLVLVLVMVFRRNLFEQNAWFRKLENTTRLGGMLSRLYRAFHTCMTHRGLLTETLLLSMVNHGFLILAAFLLGAGLQIRTIPVTDPPRPPAIQAAAEFGTYLTLFPVINGIAALPLTPGGLGTRDAAAQMLLGVPEFNVPRSRAVTLSLLVYAITFFWSLAGGIVYATGGRRPEKGTSFRQWFRFPPRPNVPGSVIE